jgi:hypothetical protein
LAANILIFNQDELKKGDEVYDHPALAGAGLAYLYNKT